MKIHPLFSAQLNGHCSIRVPLLHILEPLARVGSPLWPSELSTACSPSLETTPQSPLLSGRLKVLLMWPQRPLMPEGLCSEHLRWGGHHSCLPGMPAPCHQPQLIWLRWAAAWQHPTCAPSALAPQIPFRSL